MRNSIWKPLIMVLALAMLVTPALADTLTKHITITGTHKIAGVELKDDIYTFKIDDSKVVVELRHKLVAETNGRWEQRDTKYRSNTIVSAEDGHIQELRFAGEKRAFVIGPK
jgi:hypothetical protein